MYIRTNKINNISKTFKLLADPTRLKILSMLFSSSQAVCVSDIAKTVDMSHSAVSHQLAKLERSGVVLCERDGKTMCYEVCENAFTAKLRSIFNVIAL